MRTRRNAAPRLEAMEDRVVPSAFSIKLSPSVSAELHKLGAQVSHTAKHVQNTLANMVHQRTSQTGNNILQPHHVKVHHVSKHWLGIPFIKV